jgi:hypothetical protein
MISANSVRGAGYCQPRGRGVFEKAQMMAGHESPRTAKLDDRTSDVVSVDEVERVVF